MPPRDIAEAYASWSSPLLYQSISEFYRLSSRLPASSVAYSHECRIPFSELCVFHTHKAKRLECRCSDGYGNYFLRLSTFIPLSIFAADVEGLDCREYIGNECHRMASFDFLLASACILKPRTVSSDRSCQFPPRTYRFSVVFHVVCDRTPAPYTFRNYGRNYAEITRKLRGQPSVESTLVTL